MTLRTTAVTMMLLAASPAAAEDVFQDGNEMLDACEKMASDPVRRGFVVGYVEGLWDAYYNTHVEMQQKPPMCTPKGLMPLQLVDLACKQLRERPETRHLSAAKLLTPLFASTFPCR